MYLGQQQRQLCMSADRRSLQPAQRARVLPSHLRRNGVPPHSPLTGAPKAARYPPKNESLPLERFQLPKAAPNPKKMNRFRCPVDPA